MIPHAMAASDVILRLLHAGQLRQHWAPSAFVVSFKLETDDELLRLKAETALRRYRVHAVVRPYTWLAAPRRALKHFHLARRWPTSC